jgi:hypothetical protein
VGGWQRTGEVHGGRRTVAEVCTFQGAKTTPRGPVGLCLSGDLRGREKRAVSLLETHPGPWRAVHPDSPLNTDTRQAELLEEVDQDARP